MPCAPPLQCGYEDFSAKLPGLCTGGWLPRGARGFRRAREAAKEEINRCWAAQRAKERLGRQSEELAEDRAFFESEGRKRKAEGQQQQGVVEVGEAGGGRGESPYLRELRRRQEAEDRRAGALAAAEEAQHAERARRRAERKAREAGAAVTREWQTSTARVVVAEQQLIPDPPPMPFGAGHAAVLAAS